MKKRMLCFTMAVTLGMSMSPLVYGGISLVRGYKYAYSSNGILTQLLDKLLPNFNENWFTGFVGVLFVHTFAMTTYHILKICCLCLRKWMG